MPRSVLEIEVADGRGERLGSPVDFSHDFTVYLETLYLHGSGVNNRSGRQYQDILFFIVHIIETRGVSCFFLVCYYTVSQHWKATPVFFPIFPPLLANPVPSEEISTTPG